MRKLTTLGALITMILAFNACTNEYIPQEDYSASTTRMTVLQSEIDYCESYEIIKFLGGQHIDIGNIIVGNDTENLYVTYQTKDGWEMKETHLYVGEFAPAKSAPGQFPYKTNHKPAVTEFTYVIPLETLPACMIIAAHAATQKVVGGEVVDEQTGWGQGEQIKKGNWAMMFKYCKKVCQPEDDPDPCYQKETAWVNGARYVSQGNWATYTPYDGVEQTIDILAGQKIPVGTAHFSAPVDNMITLTINLTGGWELNADVSEKVKIQGYENAPSGNPAPGQFTTYKGEELILTLPVFNFYGIHLDVRTEIPCPEIE